MAKPTPDEIMNNIQAEDSAVWSKADQRPHALDVFEGDLSKAIAATWSDVEDGFAISSVPATGGSSTPGGPLQAGIATLSPGMLTNSASFTSIADKFSTSFPDGATKGLSAVVNAIAQGIGQQFEPWVTGYTVTLTAIGGTCAWVAGSPPSPGRWTVGSIQAAPISSGASSGDVGMTSSNLETAIGIAADPTTLKQNQGTLQPALSALIAAVAKGFETTWKQWKSKTEISGGTGTGTASPPNGAVVGSVASPVVG